MVRGLTCGCGYDILGVMIPTYIPSDARDVIRAYDLCTTRLADEFLSMRELHEAILPSLTVDDSIRDVAYDILRDGVKISIEDAIIAVRYSIAQMEVA